MSGELSEREQWERDRKIAQRDELLVRMRALYEALQDDTNSTLHTDLAVVLSDAARWMQGVTL